MNLAMKMKWDGHEHYIDFAAYLGANKGVRLEMNICFTRNKLFTFKVDL